MGNFAVGRTIEGEDHSGKIRTVHVHAKSGHQQLLVLTERRKNFNPDFRPFLNATLGNDMAQDGTFGTPPGIIHDGGSSASA